MCIAPPARLLAYARAPPLPKCQLLPRRFSSCLQHQATGLRWLTYIFVCCVTILKFYNNFKRFSVFYDRGFTLAIFKVRISRLNFEKKVTVANYSNLVVISRKFNSLKRKKEEVQIDLSSTLVRVCCTTTIPSFGLT